MNRATKAEFARALAAVVRGAKQDIEAIEKKAKSRPPGVRYPSDEYTVIVRRTPKPRRRS